MFWNKKTEGIDLDEPMIELGREIERRFVLQYAMITTFWEQEGNIYWESIDSMTRKMLNDETLTDADRIDAANKIIGLAIDWGERLTEVSSDWENFINVGLTQFEKMLEKPLLRSGLSEKVKEWTKLSKDLVKIRAKQFTAMNIHLDTDKFHTSSYDRR